MVIAEHGQNTTQGRRASGVCMLEHIASAVDAGRLAIPNAKQAIALRASKQTELLTAPDGRRAQVLVQAFPELDIMRIKPVLSRPQLLVIAPKR